MPSSEARLGAWVWRQGRVTVADLAARSKQPARVAVKRLLAAERAGLLVRSGGGKGEPFYWSHARPDIKPARLKLA